MKGNRNPKEKTDNPLNIRQEILLTKKLAEWLKKESERTQKTVGQIIRECIESFSGKLKEKA